MEIFQTDFKLWMERDILSEIYIFFHNIQSVMNPKTGKQQLWFLRSARRLTVVNISVKFEKISQTAFMFLSGNDFMTNKKDRQLLKLCFISVST